MDLLDFFMNYKSDLMAAFGLLIGVCSLVVGIKALKNTAIIKREQIKEIEAAQELAIQESIAPRAAIIEKPNDAGMGILFLNVRNYSDLIEHLQAHPDEKVITENYSGSGPYNKVETDSL